MKKTFNVEIDCAVCAQKCEDAIKKVKGVVSCNINFLTQKMILEADELEFNKILKEAEKVAKKIEPDFEIEK